MMKDCFFFKVRIWFEGLVGLKEANWKDYGFSWIEIKQCVFLEKFLFYGWNEFWVDWIIAWVFDSGINN